MLHPSVSIIASAYPVYSIWLAQVGADEPAQPDWLAQSALIWRHGALETIEAMLIDAQDLALFSHLANGGCLAELLAECTDQQAATVLIAKFLELAAAGILVPVPLIDHGENQ